MDYEHIFENLPHKSNQMNFYRGYMISTFAGIEMLINDYLASYFIDDSERKYELNEIIIDRLNFEAKRTALKTILDKKATAGGFVKTKNNTYPDSKFINNIRILNEERIKFAHYFMIDISGLPVEETELKGIIFGLTEYRDNVKTIWYTKESYTKVILLANTIRKQLFELTGLLKST